MTLRTKMIVPSAFVIGLGLALPVVAQTMDAAIDTDGDGMYSYPEMQVSLPDLTADQFGQMDASGDGMLDADEVAAAVAGGMLTPTEG